MLYYLLLARCGALRRHGLVERSSSETIIRVRHLLFVHGLRMFLLLAFLLQK